MVVWEEKGGGGGGGGGECERLETGKIVFSDRPVHVVHT